MADDNLAPFTTAEVGAPTVNFRKLDDDATKRRQYVVLGGATLAAEALPTNAAPASTAYALPVRPIEPSATSFGPTSLAHAASHEYTVVAGFCGVAVQIVGTWNGSLVFEATIDGTNWELFPMRRTIDGLVDVRTSTAGIWVGNCAGFKKIRTYMRALSSGTCTVTVHAVRAPIEHNVEPNYVSPPAPEDSEYEYQHVPVSQGSPGNTVIVAANLSLIHEIMGAVGSLSSIGTVGFTDGVDTLVGAMPTSMTGGYSMPPSKDVAYAKTGATNRPINLVTTGGSFGGVVIVRSRPERGLRPPPPIQGKDYVCMRNYMFGTSHPDGMVTLTDLTDNFYYNYVYSTNFFTGELQRYQTINATNHNLTANSLKLHAEVLGSAGAGLCKSGMLRSKQLFKYGYFECKMKVPTGKGIFPAFWLNPQDHMWPPEIDIVEIVDDGVTDRTTHSFHNNGDIIDNNNTFELTDERGKYTPGFDYHDDFHIFAAEWTPHELAYYVDNRLVKKQPYLWTHSSSYNTGLTGGEAHIIVNLGIGHPWPGAPAEGVLPCDLEIQYIRAWQRRGSRVYTRGS